MRSSSILAGALAASLLTGCQMMPGQSFEMGDSTHCLDELPTLADRSCMLESWIDFGLAAQRGDNQWREETLDRISSDSTRDRLARAVMYSWSSQESWERASELYKADLSSAPSELQPLLRQWLNSLERHRRLAQSYNESESSRRQLISERDELSKKLDALTAIEENFNLRN